MKKMKTALLALVLGSVAMVANAPAAIAADNFEIVLVSKGEGIAWFDNMRLGMEKFNKDHDDVTAWQVGPQTPDPASQVALVNDLIAKGVDAIIVVPIDPEAMVPAFKKANEAGILTFTHESSGQRGVSYDLEAFVNVDYGRHMLDVAAEWMGKEGQWQPFVGHLTSPTHNQWVDGEEAQAKEKYPNLTQARDRVEDLENQQVALERSLELLKTYPDLKVILGSAGSTVPGAAEAIEQRGMIGKVAAFGTTLPSVAGDYLESGAAQSIHFWVPADAGYATAVIALKVLKGEDITAGLDLGLPGYGNVTIEKNEHGVPVVFGQAWVDVNKENLDDWKDENGKYKL